MNLERKCSCGIITIGVPANARLLLSEDDFAGYYFECKCKSTVFIPLSEVIKKK